MGTADDLLDRAQRLCADGNEFAAMAVARIMVSDDPDVEAQRIIKETRAVVARIAEILDPLIHRSDT